MRKAVSAVDPPSRLFVFAAVSCFSSSSSFVLHSGLDDLPVSR